MLEILKKGNILKKIEYKNYAYRMFFLILSCFLCALNYNVFFVPNSIVVGGISGLAIVVKEVTGIGITYFYYTAVTVLIVVGYFIYGKKKSLNTIIGTVIYAVMISVTEPIALYLNINLESTFLIILCSAVINGVTSGMIYRTGFNTGGSDVIATILNKMFKIPLGQANRLVNAIIIGCGLIVFGINKTIIAITILIISTKLLDVVLLGLNDSKICYIKTKEYKKIKEELLIKYNIGVTEIDTNGGIFTKMIPTLLVIIPFDMYYGLKKVVLSIDKKAFIVSHDCYAVSGGYKKSLLPF